MQTSFHTIVVVIQGTILDSSSVKEKVLVQQQQLHGSETDSWRRQVAEVEAQKTDLEKQLREAQHLLSMQEQLQGLFSQEEQATKRQLAVEQQKLARAEEELGVLESLVVRVQYSLEEQVALQRSSMTGSHELICQACAFLARLAGLSGDGCTGDEGQVSTGAGLVVATPTICTPRTTASGTGKAFSLSDSSKADLSDLQQRIEQTLRKLPPIEMLVSRLPQADLAQALEFATQALIAAIRAREVNTVAASAAEQSLLHTLHDTRLHYQEKALAMQVATSEAWHVQQLCLETQSEMRLEEQAIRRRRMQACSAAVEAAKLVAGLDLDVALSDLSKRSVKESWNSSAELASRIAADEEDWTLLGGRDISDIAKIAQTSSAAHIPGITSSVGCRNEAQTSSSQLRFLSLEGRAAQGRRDRLHENLLVASAASPDRMPSGSVGGASGVYAGMYTMARGDILAEQRGAGLVWGERAGERAAQMSIKLALDYVYAGEEATPQRAMFIDTLTRDLSTASSRALLPHASTERFGEGLLASNFQVHKVSGGSVPRTTVVDMYVHSDPADHFKGLDAASVAASLELQARDPSSILRSGAMARYIQAITLYSNPVVQSLDDMTLDGRPSSNSRERRAFPPTGGIARHGSGQAAAEKVELILDQDFESNVGRSDRQAADFRFNLARKVASSLSIAPELVNVSSLAPKDKIVTVSHQDIVKLKGNILAIVEISESPTTLRSPASANGYVQTLIAQVNDSSSSLRTRIPSLVTARTLHPLARDLPISDIASEAGPHRDSRGGGYFFDTEPDISIENVPRGVLQEGNQKAVAVADTRKQSKEQEMKMQGQQQVLKGPPHAPRQFPRGWSPYECTCGVGFGTAEALATHVESARPHEQVLTLL